MEVLNTKDQISRNFPSSFSKEEKTPDHIRTECKINLPPLLLCFILIHFVSSPDLMLGLVSFEMIRLLKNINNFAKSVS
jgi:hypothetical protein